MAWSSALHDFASLFPFFSFTVTTGGWRNGWQDQRSRQMLIVSRTECDDKAVKRNSVLLLCLQTSLRRCSFEVSAVGTTLITFLLLFFLPILTLSRALHDSVQNFVCEFLSSSKIFFCAFVAAGSELIDAFRAESSNATKSCQNCFKPGRPLSHKLVLSSSKKDDRLHQEKHFLRRRKNTASLCLHF